MNVNNSQILFGRVLLLGLLLGYTFGLLIGSLTIGLPMGLTVSLLVAKVLQRFNVTGFRKLRRM